MSGPHRTGGPAAERRTRAYIPGAGCWSALSSIWWKLGGLGQWGAGGLEEQAVDLREPCRVLEAGPVGRYWGVLGVFRLQLVNRGWRRDILPSRVSICWTILVFGCQTLGGGQYLGHKGSRCVGTPTRHMTRDSTAA